MDDAALLAAIREHAYLEGDFVLRSGRRSSYYLDKYRFETRPELLEALGRRIAEAVTAHSPDVRRRRARCRRVALVPAAVPDRPQGAEGVRHREPARRRVRAGRARVSRGGR